jgi:hypothetical protein
VARERFINVRKLAAFDIYFRGPGRTLFEFGFAVFVFGALGAVATIVGVRSHLVVGVGVYLVLLAADYAPLFAYSVAIFRGSSAKQELAAELADLEHSRVKYGLQRILLLVPLLIPLLAAAQELARRDSKTPAGA